MEVLTYSEDLSLAPVHQGVGSTQSSNVVNIQVLLSIVSFSSLPD